jgi:hypothetical protein
VLIDPIENQTNVRVLQKKESPRHLAATRAVPPRTLLKD